MGYRDSKKVDPVQEIKERVAASIYILPCTLDDLLQRDFLKGYSEYSVDRILQMLENDKWVYQRGEVYHTYKKIAENELSEYELV